MEEDRRKRSKWDDTDRSERQTDKDYRERPHNEKEGRYSQDRDYRDRDRDRQRDKEFSREKDRERDRDREVTDWDRNHGSARSNSSRWDDSSSRRSRSPRSPQRSRSRSPSREVSAPLQETKQTPDPAAAAAAAAARINAQLQAKRGIQSSDDSAHKPRSAGKVTGSGAPTLNNDIYMADGDYIRDIEVNDLRNRYTLTKGSTQKMIKEETGADVTTRGAYYPDKAMATPQNPPLYLHVTSTTKEGLEKAIEKIEHLMQQELGSLVDERRFRRREPPEPVERDEYGRRKWPEERVYVGLEPIPGFNLRASVVGHQGMYVKHIQQETRCRVQIKGRGSSFLENGRESDEPMYLHVTGPDPKEVQNAKELCEDLIKSVKEQYEQYKSQPQPNRFQNYGNHHSSGYGSHGTQGHQSSQGQTQHRTQSQSQTPTQPSQSATTAPSNTPSNSDYGVQSYNPYAGFNGADPYAAYGGYQAYAAYYAQYYAQQQQPQTQAISGPPGASNASTNNYNSVKPPPGL